MQRAARGDFDGYEIAARAALSEGYSVFAEAFCAQFEGGGDEGAFEFSVRGEDECDGGSGFAEGDGRAGRVSADQAVGEIDRDGRPGGVDIFGEGCGFDYRESPSVFCGFGFETR